MSFERSLPHRSHVPRYASAIAAIGLCVGSSPVTQAADSPPVETQITMSAGTVFNLAPVFDSQGAPVFPWLHEVRGLVQVSNLGNAIVGFNVSIHGGNACEGNHAFCLSGTMTITTLAGEKLHANVVGWADADPNDSKPSPSMYLLHYDTTITGGTGKLAGASGHGVVTGAFMFSDTDATDDPDHSDNTFCNAYAGVATWRFDGVMTTPVVPALRIEAAPDRKVTVSWPASAQGWRLQTKTALGQATWSEVGATAAEASGRKQVAVPATEGSQFYRLKRE